MSESAAPMPTPAPAPRAATSRSVWALIGVEGISFLGSEIARFGVSVFVYQATQSVSAFATLILANSVPGLLVSPFAGGIVDRHSRKAVMLGAATVAMCGTLIVLAGAAFGHLSMLPIVAGAMLASVGEAFQWPALSATLPLMATEEELPRYNGFLESARAASMLAGPVLGGLLIAFLKLPGLLAVEVGTFLTATVVVASLTIPPPPAAADDEPASLVGDSLFGLRFIAAHRPLLKFLCVAVFGNFFLSIGMVLMPAYGLGLLSEKAYGAANGLFGGGMIAGGVAYGLVEKRFKNIGLFVWTAALAGALYGLYGFSRSIWSLGALNFCIAVMMTIGNASIMTIWQTKVPEQYQGRVLSAMRMVAFSVGPISYLIAGPLADRLVPKLFVGSSALGRVATQLWGDSKPAQLGFLFSVMGVLMGLGFVLAWMIEDVRRVEDIPV